MIGQGIVLMAAGMGIVYLFLSVLIIVTKTTMAFVSRYDAILPESAAPKAKARPAAAASGDADVALAIAVALKA